MLMGGLADTLTGLLLKVPIAIAVALVVIPSATYPCPEFGRIFVASILIAVLGPLAFTLVQLLPLGLLGDLLAIAIYWVIVSTILDKYFDVHYDQSYSITGRVVVPTILVWIIAGFVISLLMPPVR